MIQDNDILLWVLVKLIKILSSLKAMKAIVHNDTWIHIFFELYNTMSMTNICYHHSRGTSEHIILHLKHTLEYDKKNNSYWMKPFILLQTNNRRFLITTTHALLLNKHQWRPLHLLTIRPNRHHFLVRHTYTIGATNYNTTALQNYLKAFVLLAQFYESRDTILL